MTAIICWVCLAAVLLGLAGVLGRRVSYVETVNGTDQLVSGRWLGILIDYRKRYSLAHFQVVVWSLVLLSLVGAVFLARLLARVPAEDHASIAALTDPNASPIGYHGNVTADADGHPLWNLAA